jgi:hypothetical protein
MGQLKRIAAQVVEHVYITWINLGSSLEGGVDLGPVPQLPVGIPDELDGYHIVRCAFQRDGVLIKRLSEIPSVVMDPPGGLVGLRQIRLQSQSTVSCGLLSYQVIG